MIRSSVRGKRVYLTVCGNEIAPILRMIMRGGKEQRIERISIEHRHRQAESSWKEEKRRQLTNLLGDWGSSARLSGRIRLSACRGKGLAGWPPFRCLSHRAQGDKPSCKLQPHGEGPNQSQEAGEIRRADGRGGRKQANLGSTRTRAPSSPNHGRRKVGGSFETAREEGGGIERWFTGVVVVLPRTSLLRSIETDKGGGGGENGGGRGRQGEGGKESWK
jgi:hypothetical protein